MLALGTWRRTSVCEFSNPIIAMFHQIIENEKNSPKKVRGAQGIRGVASLLAM
jgi:hypothetical protein